MEAEELLYFPLRAIIASQRERRRRRKSGDFVFFFIIITAHMQKLRAIRRHRNSMMNERTNWRGWKRVNLEHHPIARSTTTRMMLYAFEIDTHDLIVARELTRFLVRKHDPTVETRTLQRVPIKMWNSNLTSGSFIETHCTGACKTTGFKRRAECEEKESDTNRYGKKTELGFDLQVAIYEVKSGGYQSRLLRKTLWSRPRKCNSTTHSKVPRAIKSEQISIKGAKRIWSKQRRFFLSFRMVKHPLLWKRASSSPVWSVACKWASFSSPASREKKHSLVKGRRQFTVTRSQKQAGRARGHHHRPRSVSQPIH